MKTKQKPYKGRAAFARKLKQNKTPKAEAFKLTAAKFDCSQKAFDKIWSTKPKGL